jgi:hypothetical protein
MKKLLATIFIAVSFGVAFAPAYNCATIFRAEGINPYEKLILAVVQVESNGNVYALNKHEGAFGSFQIRECRLRDYNARNGSKYILSDMYDYELAKKVFNYYCQGRDFETIAKEWNGKSKHNHYWAKVLEQLNKI